VGRDRAEVAECSTRHRSDTRFDRSHGARNPFRNDLLPSADEVAESPSQRDTRTIDSQPVGFFAEAIFFDLSFMTALNVRASSP